MTAMELRDLTHEERLALVALLELVIESDRRASEGEITEVDRVVEAFGADAYQALVEEVDRRFPTEEALKDFVPSIGRQDARELIYGTVLDTAIEDAVDVWESSLLDWLAKLWNVRIDFNDPDIDDES
jgi:hypothetical protein